MEPASSAAAPPFAIECIDHVLLLVNSTDDALRFYETVLGCSVESRLPQFGMTELRAGCSHIDLVDVSMPQAVWAKPPVAGGRNVDHVALAVDAVDEKALRSHLAAHGVAVIEEREEGDGSLSLYVRDPYGNTIELLCRGLRPSAPR